jgi:hypothetical protein
VDGIDQYAINVDTYCDVHACTCEVNGAVKVCTLVVHDRVNNYPVFTNPRTQTLTLLTANVNSYDAVRRERDRLDSRPELHLILAFLGFEEIRNHKKS